MMLRFRWLWIALLLIAGCTSDAALPPTALPLPTVAAQTTLPATVERTLRAVSSQMPGVTPTPGQCQASADLPTTQHTVSATVSYALHRAVVQQHVQTINRSGDLLTDVVFDVEANRYPGIFELTSVSADLGVASYDLAGRRLTLHLAQAFAPGCTLDADLVFIVHVPEVAQTGATNGGYFGYTSHQLNLGQWLPMLAWRHDGQWITHDVSTIGEQVVVEVADWDVTLTVIDAPASLVVALPGTLVDHTGTVWHYTMANARDSTLSMSPDYQMVTEQTDNNVQVEIYTFGNRTTDTSQGAVDNVHQALHAAAQAISTYSQAFGAYPYKRFVVVQGDFSDGMEFSGIVFVSNQWFLTNTGTAQSYLTIITVHETSHQWWYARVGSDQAITPWMDEALAVYSEYIFYEDHYPTLTQWWWNFRVDSYVSASYSGKRVDSTVYDFSDARDYINAVYLRGAHMLDDLRQDLGTDAFFAWLRAYATVGQNRVMTPDDLWSLLTPEQLDATRATRAKYLSSDQT